MRFVLAFSALLIVAPPLPAQTLPEYARDGVVRGVYDGYLIVEPFAPEASRDVVLVDEDTRVLGNGREQGIEILQPGDPVSVRFELGEEYRSEKIELLSTEEAERRQEQAAEPEPGVFR